MSPTVDEELFQEQWPIWLLSAHTNKSKSTTETSETSSMPNDRVRPSAVTSLFVIQARYPPELLNSNAISPSIQSSCQRLRCLSRCHVEPRTNRIIMKQKLWLLIIFLIALTSCVNASNNKKLGPLPPQRFEMEPIDKTAVIGDTIILPCRVENKVGTLQWTRDGFGLGTERTLEGFQRYRMVGSDDEGDYSLEISPVALEDDAVFQCQVGAVEGVLGIRSRSATFTVQVPPEAPVIVVTHAHSHAQVYKSTDVEGEVSVSAGGVAPGPSGKDHHLRTTAGMTIELTCEAHSGRPPAELTWMDSMGNPITNGVSYSTTKLGDGKRWNAALKWTVVASRALDGQRVTCRSENAALKSPRYAHIQIEVRYQPEVELRIASAPDDGLVREGDDLTLECIAVGNPSRMTFKWSRDGVPLGVEGDPTGATGDGTPRLVFRRVGREFHGTVIACEVANSVGTSRAKLEVNIAFKPRFAKPPEPVIGIAKSESVRLECNLDSYPKANIYWSKYVPKLSMDPSTSERHYPDQWLKLGEGPFIEVESAGRYRCLGKNNAFDDELKGETLVFIKGAPLIRSPSVQYGVENEPVRLQCIVEAIPPPTKITWFKLKPYQQILGVDNNEGYEILEEEDPEDFLMPSVPSASYLTSSAMTSSNGADDDQWPVSSLALLRSIIYIRRAKDSDFGQYNCSVWNQYGFQSQIITLQKQANILSPLVLTLSGIVACGVIFVLVASLIVFACIRSQRLRQEQSLAPKKLESNDGSRHGIGCATSCNGSLTNAHNDELKNMLMKNTIMKMTSSNQVLTTLANGTEAYTTSEALPVYEYDYNYSYPSNDLVIANGNVITNTNALPSYTYDTTSPYGGHYLANDYTSQLVVSVDDKGKSAVALPPSYHQTDSSINPQHLYSTVMKQPNSHSNGKVMMNDGGPSGAANFSSFTSNTANSPANSTNILPKMLNSSNSQPSISSSEAPGHGLPQSYANTVTYSSGMRNTTKGDQFVNPYVRTSNNGTVGSNFGSNHYTNLESSDRMLSAGVYSAHQHARYKTNSLGGGSSSSGVISAGGSSPGHSPVGSMSAPSGTHV